MVSLRDNLLVTAGARAAYMECRELIDLPGGVTGEEELAIFLTIAVDHYIEASKEKEINFDEFIEMILVKNYNYNYVIERGTV